MTDAVIELNDCEVSVIQSGNIVASSPGIAVIKEDRTRTGTGSLAIHSYRPEEYLQPLLEQSQPG